MYQAKNHKNTVVTEDTTDTAAPSAAGRDRQARQNILIVDDSEMNRAILSEILCGDYRILEAVAAVPAADTAACRQSRRSVVPRIVFLSPLNLPDTLDQGDDHTDHHCRRDGHKERQHRQGRRTGRIHLEGPEEEPDQPRHQD